MIFFTWQKKNSFFLNNVEKNQFKSLVFSHMLVIKLCSAIKCWLEKLIFVFFLWLPAMREKTANQLFLNKISVHKFSTFFCKWYWNIKSDIKIRTIMAIWNAYQIGIIAINICSSFIIGILVRGLVWNIRGRWGDWRWQSSCWNCYDFIRTYHMQCGC